MCTVTVFPCEGGFVLTMNRDEFIARSEKGLKSVFNADVNFGYPVDGLKGGSWAGINNHGVALALLNNYHGPLTKNALSRGTIIPEVLNNSDKEAAIEYLKNIDLSVYNPFDCLLITSNTCYQLSWNRINRFWREININTGFMMTSSSERFDQVYEYRSKKFSQWQSEKNSLSTLGHFHLSQESGQLSESVLMSRKFTHTKSLVQVFINSTEARLNYYDHSSLKKNIDIAQLSITAQLLITL